MNTFFSTFGRLQPKIRKEKETLIFKLRNIKKKELNLMANRGVGQPKEYDHLFKLLIIGDSGK
jgi:hypothetical protein